MAKLSDDDMSQLLEEFLRETREGLDAIEGDLIELEQRPEDRGILENIFRTIHTIKGSAGFLSLSSLEGIAHVSEDILTRAMGKKLILTPAAISALLEAIDRISRIVDNLQATGKEGDVSHDALLRRLKAINESAGRRTTKLSKVIATDAPLAGENESWGLFDEPAAERATDRVSPAPQPPATAPAQPPAAPVVAALQAAASNDEEHADEGRSAPAKVESSIRIDVRLLDKLMNLVGELVLCRNQLLQFNERFDDAAFGSVMHRTSLVTSELQEHVMKARMQPIGTVFAKFPRVVRDMALMTGKQIELQVQGEETELDRTIHEGIRDPLVHMIRNACDHGIETPEVRRQAGKPAGGTVSISAYHEGGQINIRIADDGKGVDVQKVKAKAVTQGLITSAQATEMSERDALELIFRPGLSTAEQITKVSGRGVGMDVVKTSVERIGGSIELESVMGKGTAVNIKIPLTLAIIPALIVRCDDERFAIPQICLRELVRIEDGGDRRIENVRGAEVLRLRGRLLPLIRMTSLLGLNSRKNENEEGVENIVVTVAGGREIGLVVDEVSDVEEIVVKPLSRHLKNLNYYAGATIMGDGKVALILDPIGLASQCRGEEAAEGQDKARARGRESEAGSGKALQTTLVFSVGEDDRFALPLRLVSRLEEFLRPMIETVDGRRVVQYRDSILPLVEASQFFSVTPYQEPLPDTVSVIVFEVDQRSVGLVVHRIVDIVEADLSRMNSTGRAPGVHGSAVIEGRTTLLLDIYSLLRRDPRVLGEAIPHAAESERMTIGGRVLVIDDSAFFRAILDSYLSESGYTVTVAKGGEAGIEAFAAASFDLVVCDLEMPGCDGFEVATTIRASGKGKAVPMLACSALEASGTRERVMQAGFTEYLVKLDKQELISAVDRLMAERSNASEVDRRDGAERRSVGGRRGTDERRLSLADRREDRNRQLVTFFLKDQHFAVDVDKVQEIILPQSRTAIPLAQRQYSGLINLRGQIVTAIDPRILLGLDHSEAVDEYMNLVISSDGDRVSLLFDRIGDVIEVAESAIESPPDTLDPALRRYVREVAKLEHGLLLVIDIQEVAHV